jgi:hypothetical protein
MVLKKRYESLADTLNHILIQAKESVNYCRDLIPEFITTPEQLFYFLKTIVIYKNDPKGVELLQTAQTLFENNYHGIPGMGDCDCFTILSLACFKALNFKKYGIILVGKSSKIPTHIYCFVVYQKKPYIFDLTNDLFNYERPYKYKQVLGIKF